MAAQGVIVAARAAAIATGNKKIRNGVVIIILAGLFLLISPVIFISSIAKSGADIDYRSPEVVSALTNAVTDEQKEKIGYLDKVMKKLQEVVQKSVPKTDFVKIQIFYLCILYGEEKESDTFYKDFTNCFKDTKSDDEIFGNIEKAFDIKLTKKDRQDVTALYAAVMASGGMAGGDFGKLIEVAKAQLGKPYVWGAAGPDSFDCSGFIVYCFKAALGKSIPRTAAEQQVFCKQVKSSDKKPGDLIFFANTYKPGVSHVGIYLGGNKMIHAPGTGDVVRYADFTVGDFASHFHSFGRVK
jgi:hypothetical protein